MMAHIRPISWIVSIYSHDYRQPRFDIRLKSIKGAICVNFNNDTQHICKICNIGKRSHTT